MTWAPTALAICTKTLRHHLRHQCTNSCCRPLLGLPRTNISVEFQGNGQAALHGAETRSGLSRDLWLSLRLWKFSIQYRQSVVRKYFRRPFLKRLLCFLPSQYSCNVRPGVCTGNSTAFLFVTTESDFHIHRITVVADLFLIRTSLSGSPVFFSIFVSETITSEMSTSYIVSLSWVLESTLSQIFPIVE